MHTGIPEIRIRRRILDHNIKETCIITSYYGKFAIEVLPSQSNQTAHHKQTDQIEYRTLNGFHRIHENIQNQNSQRANSIVTNDVFSIIYSYISILELKKNNK